MPGPPAVTCARSVPDANLPLRSRHPVPASQSVQTFGRKKNAVAVSYCKKGRGLIKINGCPIELVEPEVLRYKVFEPILLLGRERFAIMDLRIRVKGGGYTSQIYAIRQAIAKSVVSYYQKCAHSFLLPNTHTRHPPLSALVSRSCGRCHGLWGKHMMKNHGL